MTLLITLIVFLKYAMCINGNFSQPETRIFQGVLRGQYLKTINNRTISAFTGVPYAEAPVGDLRFELAKPPKPWNGTLNATKRHPLCPQINIALGSSNIKGDEDCLYLNIYTPKLEFRPVTELPLLPVMISIHGGAFLLGSANRHEFNPDYFLDRDIVLITINYRLGPLGFISTNDHIMPGNNGLKDQSLAIKWTKINVAHFGGDPNNITLFGQSAGGASTHFHMLSPLSKDLIKGVISQSGTALSAWALDPNNRTRRNTLRLASSFDCSNVSSEAILNCLKKVDAYEITKRQHEFSEWYLDPLVPFSPVIENGIPGAFLPDHPIEIIKSGKAAKIPFMTGITTEDGAMKSSGLFGRADMLEDLSANFESVAPITFLYSETSPNPNYVTAKIKDFYFQNESIDNSSFSRKAVTDVLVYTDSYFLSGSNDAVWLHINYTRDPVYYYTFGYRGIISYSELFGGGSYNFGVCHADELLYLFYPNYSFPNYELKNNDCDVKNLLTTLWTNFAYSGNPTPILDDVVHFKWEPVQSENLEYYSIRNYTDVGMSEKPFWSRTQFWKSLPIN